MKFIPNSVSVKFAAHALKTQENAPSLLFFAGIAGMTASTILACRSTLYLEDVLQHTATNVETANDLRKRVQDQDDELYGPDKYTDTDLKKDLAVIYIRSGVDMAKLYAPAVLLGAASVTALTKSHNMLQERNLALTAAYAAVDEAFKKYRAKVVDKYGEDEDRLLRFEAKEQIVVDEKGKETKRLRVDSDHMPSMYARFFDEFCVEWSPEPEYNFTFLRQQQNWFNDLLKMRGYVFLNQVYEALGMTPTEAGQVVGWMLDDEGDSYIDFGLFTTEGSGVIDFMNGRANSVLLDFNVDGTIYHKLSNFDPSGRKESFKPWQK